MRMESPLNQRLRRSPPDVVYTPIDVTSSSRRHRSSRSSRLRLPGRARVLAWFTTLTPSPKWHISLRPVGMRAFRVCGGDGGGSNYTWNTDDQSSSPPNEDRLAVFFLRLPAHHLHRRRHRHRPSTSSSAKADVALAVPTLPEEHTQITSSWPTSPRPSVHPSCRS